MPKTIASPFVHLAARTAVAFSGPAGSVQLVTTWDNEGAWGEIGF
jgi:hypothetical protein